MSRPVQLQICGHVMYLPPPSFRVAVLTPPLLWPQAPPPQPSPFPSTVFSPSTAVSDEKKESSVLFRRKINCSCSDLLSCGIEALSIDVTTPTCDRIYKHLNQFLPGFMVVTHLISRIFRKCMSTI